MIINCQREDLLVAIQTVGRGISTKNTLPILGGILINASNNTLSLRTTDLDISIQSTISADVKQEGEVVIADGKRFIDIVRQLPEETINLSLINDFDININYGVSSLSIRGFESEQFPLLPGLEGEIKGSIEGAVFARMVKQVAIAVSNEESRPILTGILLDIKESELIMVATDSHRLALAKGTWDGSGNYKFIVPARTMQEVGKIGAGEEQVKMTISKNNVAFEIGNNLFISRLISGAFPDYNPIIPQDEDYKYNVFIAKKEFNNALSRASILSRDNSNIVKLELKETEIILTANSPEIGNIREIIPATITGEGLFIGYNVKYILDALKVIDQETIHLKLTGSVTPGIVVPEGDDSYIYLLLPVRIG